MSADASASEDAGHGPADAGRRDLSRAERALTTVPGRISGPALAFWLVLVAVGGIGFWTSVGEDPARAWSTTWANLLFWTALAQAGVVFGAVLQAAKGHWGKPFRRLAEGTGAFLPVSFLLLAAVLVWGAPHVFPWVDGAAGARGHVNLGWLTLDGVLWRNLLWTAALYLLSLWWLRVALRVDTPELARRLSGWRRTLVEWIRGGWEGTGEELERIRGRAGWLAPVLILAWVAVFTMLSFDLSMSLIPGFLSVVWGPLFFVGGWLSMLALVAVLAWAHGSRYELEHAWGKWSYHDLGKLLFAFTIFWAYLWWSQYLVIWYGNLGRETIFFEQRTGGGFGAYWLQMVLLFGVPFVALLWRKPKMKPAWLAFVSMFTLAGFWLQRHLLVEPSTLEAGFRLGWPEISVSLGFLGLFGLCYSLFASTFPKVPIRDLLVGEASTGP